MQRVNREIEIPGYATKSQRAKQLGKSERTLDRWHELRIGPPRIKIGNLILYPDDAFQEWLQSHLGAA